MRRRRQADDLIWAGSDRHAAAGLFCATAAFAVAAQQSEDSGLNREFDLLPGGLGKRLFGLGRDGELV